MECKILLISVCGFVVNPLLAEEKTKPNILFILADDFGYNQLGCYGDKPVQTPNLDNLANEGIRFTNAYVMPQSSPTRGAFFTGQYPARTRMTGVTHVKPFEKGYVSENDWRREIPSEWYNIAKMMQSAGYVTGISGKWHIAGSYSLVGNKKKYGDDYYKSYGFDWTGNADDNNEDKGVMSITEEICSFMEKNKDRPFFAWVSHFTTHTALAAPESLVKKYEQLGFKRSTDIWGNTEERPTADFLAMTEYMDTSVGILMKKLDDLGLRDNTVVVFMGDNGALGRCWNHSPLRGAKGSLYEGGIKTPFIVCYPEEITPESISEEKVHIIDLFPTFMEITGGIKPADHILDGTSLCPIWDSERKFTRKTLYFHHPHYEEMYAKSPSSAIIEDNYKLIHCYGDYYDTKGYKEIHKVPFGRLVKGERFELFDLDKDPGESVDISKHKPEKVQELLYKLNTWLQSVNAQIPEKK